MKRINFLAGFLLLALLSWGQAKRITIPDIPGYKTLKCDFHMHTVFSDGAVWPTVRVSEAIREGLDAIAITDHIEYRPYHDSGDVVSDHNRSYIIARDFAKGLPDSLIVIHGSEVTRDMPPGHLNAIFLKDSNPLDTPDWHDALMAAKEQGAFIFWNHPNWKVQAPPDGIPKWYDEHTRLWKDGCIMGIEMFSGGNYSPLAYGWTIEKNLTVLCNHDAHSPLFFVFPAHRNITLVFATERSEKGIHDALIDHRTVAYSRTDDMCGDEKFLKALIDGSLRTTGTVRDGDKVRVTVVNTSSLVFKLRTLAQEGGVTLLPEKIVIGPFESVDVEISTVKGKMPRQLDFVVENFFAKPDEGMKYSYRL